MSTSVYRSYVKGFVTLYLLENEVSKVEIDSTCNNQK